MEIKTYEQRILIPDKDKYLYNRQAQCITNEEVYLGINASVEDWVEITEEEKQEIEKNLENQGI